MDDDDHVDNDDYDDMILITMMSSFTRNVREQ